MIFGIRDKKREQVPRNLSPESLSSRQKGFALLEVLIAVLILAVAVTAFMGGISATLRLAQRAEATSRALWELEKVLFMLESSQRMDLISYGGAIPSHDDSMILESLPVALDLRTLMTSPQRDGKDGEPLELLMREGGVG